MTEKEIIKYIDILFEKITDFNAFSINNILFKELNPDEKDKVAVKLFLDIEKETKLFGLNNDLFEKYNDNGWFSLTEKGKQLKLSKLSFEKFCKKSKKKSMTNFEKWSLFLITLPIIINLIQWNYSLTLKSELDSCNTELDSLKNELYLKKSIKIENIERIKADTLKTK